MSVTVTLNPQLEADARAAVLHYQIELKKEREADKLLGRKSAKSRVEGPTSMRTFFDQACLLHVRLLEDRDNRGKEFKRAPKRSGNLPNTFMKRSRTGA